MIYKHKISTEALAVTVKIDIDNTSPAYETLLRSGLSLTNLVSSTALEVNNEIASAVFFQLEEDSSHDRDVP